MINKARVNKPICGRAFHFRDAEEVNPRYEGQFYTIVGNWKPMPNSLWPALWEVQFEDGEKFWAFASEVFPGGGYRV
jgi:hypothetical protein